MPVVQTILKNTNTHTVVRLVGDGASTITLANLTTSIIKSATTVNTNAVVTVLDTDGIVINGTVSGTGITGGTTVLSVKGNQVTLSAPATASGTANLTFGSQVAVAPKVDIYKVFFSGSPTTPSTIVRNAVTVLQTLGTGTWQFDGFAVSDQNTSNIVATLSTGSCVIIELKKVSGYGDSQHPYQSPGN